MIVELFHPHLFAFNGVNKRLKAQASDALLKKLLGGAEITGRLPIGCERLLIRQGLIVI